MHALLVLMLTAMAAQADEPSVCTFHYPLAFAECDAFEEVAHELLTRVKPEGLSITELKQNTVTFILYVEPTGQVTGNEGAVMTDTLCGLAGLKPFLDGTYNMSVRMTTREGETTVLDEIAYIQDCEAN